MRQRHGTVTNFTMSGSSQQTAAFSSETWEIRIATGAQPAYFAIGADPTASSSTQLVGANVVDYVTVTPGQGLAVLQAGTAGVFSVTELV